MGGESEEKISEEGQETNDQCLESKEPVVEVKNLAANGSSESADPKQDNPANTSEQVKAVKDDDEDSKEEIEQPKAVTQEAAISPQQQEKNVTGQEPKKRGRKPNPKSKAKAKAKSKAKARSKEIGRAHV